MKKTILMVFVTATMTAQAEDVFSAMFESTASNMQNTAMTTAISGAVQTTADKAKPVAKSALLTFKPNPKTTAALQDQIFKALLEKAPGKHNEIKNMLKQADVVNNMRKAVKDLGYDPNELAVSLTLWVNTSFGQLEDRDTTEAENDAVLKQFRSAVDRAAALKKLSNEDRQKTSELLMYMTFFQMVDHMAAQQNKTGYDMEAVKGYIAENLKRFDLDPETFTITDSGITRKD
ncbi:DUF6683 family protein [Deinococcus cellulosilyticus]|uniref:Uncharacterized protein n=1 Tax=Deinococcus cellulosilyticus (strain DSM 18568 / NBRC 106333 / KACC 11606 / 5516J-15) TaxID=1223518 RepID=A0A511N1G8_DEIC1|nr:DUF6683 family protein [Deinococcus cellulosilyticus]GEM46176.1 hypothetical protein DC3_18110 [Deinococcus cellulosilyticus NBRC 106333 = KACC 11606]